MNYTFQGIGIGIGEIQLVLRDEMNNDFQELFSVSCECQRNINNIKLV